MKKVTILKRRAKEFREFGEERLADQITARAVALENNSSSSQTSSATRTATPSAELPKDVICWTAGDRIFIQPPPLRHGGVTRALAYELKKVSTDKEGEKHYKYEGGAFKKGSPECSQWSFTNDESLFERVQNVLGNFFSGGKLLTPGGKQIGQLPISTYKKAQAS